MKYYILDGHTPVEADPMAGAKFFGDFANRRVAVTMIDDVYVSTVFLCIDHNFIGKGPPILFETMTFGMVEDESGNEVSRYTTWDEAVAGHKIAVEAAREAVIKAKKIVAESMGKTFNPAEIVMVDG